MNWLLSYLPVYFAVIFCIPIVLTSTTKCRFLQPILPYFFVEKPFASFNQCSKMKSLSDWSFSQPSLLSKFPIDPIQENHVRRVPGCVFSRVQPTPLKSELKLVSSSRDVLQTILDLDPKEEANPEFAKFIAGNKLLPGSETLAHRYGGYQFGYWADQLGDGRAIMIGEYINQYVDFNTPYIIMSWH